MNETEKRRKRLLEQTRIRYQDDKTIPAVHPRYKASYYEIYPEKNELHPGTFGIRCIICVLIFGIYLTNGLNFIESYKTSNLQVREIIMQNIHIKPYF